MSELVKENYDLRQLVKQLQAEVDLLNKSESRCLVDLKAENQRLKELILQGEDFVEEEWQTIRRFGTLSAKQWYGGMMDEIAKIKAAQPQKGQDNESR